MSFMPRKIFENVQLHAATYEPMPGKLRSLTAEEQGLRLFVIDEDLNRAKPGERWDVELKRLTKNNIWKIALIQKTAETPKDYVIKKAIPRRSKPKSTKQTFTSKQFLVNVPLVSPGKRLSNSELYGLFGVIDDAKVFPFPVEIKRHDARPGQCWDLSISHKMKGSNNWSASLIRRRRDLAKRDNEDKIS